MVTAQARDRQPAAIGVRRGVAGPALTAVAALIAGGYIAAVDPNEAGHYPTCPFLFLTGLFCPGCGSLRAVHAVWHGHLAEALGFNPLTVALLPLALALWVVRLRRAVTGRPGRWTAAPWALWTMFAVVAAFTVLRNLPWFAGLAP